MARKPKRPPRSPAIRARRLIARRPRGVPPAAAGLDLHRCEQFLINEARLLDEGKFDDWLALFTPDAWYWVPSEPNQRDTARPSGEHSAMAMRLAQQKLRSHSFFHLLRREPGGDESLSYFISHLLRLRGNKGSNFQDVHGFVHSQIGGHTFFELWW